MWTIAARRGWSSLTTIGCVVGPGRRRFCATVGAAVSGRVLIVDDVITAGTAVREACDIIAGLGADVAGLVISLDRQERGQTDRSAVQELEQKLSFPVISIVRLDDLVERLEGREEFHEQAYSFTRGSNF